MLPRFQSLQLEAASEKRAILFDFKYTRVEIYVHAYYITNYIYIYIHIYYVYSIYYIYTIVGSICRKKKERKKVYFFLIPIKF